MTTNTTTQIESLTPEQQARFPAYRDQWLAIGKQSGKPLPSDSELLQLFAAIYKESGLPAPARIIRTRGPRELMTTAMEFGGLSYSEAFSNILSGCQEAAWLSFYAFLLGETPQVKGPERLIPLMNLAKAGVGWCIPFEKTIIVSPVPEFIHMRPARDTMVAHCTTGPYIRYADGTELFALNGVQFRGDMIRFITTPADQLTAQEVLGIINAEQRMEVIKRIGLHKFIDKLQHTVLDTSTEHQYRLLSIDLGSGIRKYLQMQNPSVPETHLEAVHPDCTTVNQALQWRNFGTVSGKWIAPLKLT